MVSQDGAPLRTFVVERQSLIAKALHSFLNQNALVRVVGDAPSVRVDDMERTRPDLIVYGLDNAAQDVTEALNLAQRSAERAVLRSLQLRESRCHATQHRFGCRRIRRQGRSLERTRCRAACLGFGCVVRRSAGRGRHAQATVHHRCPGFGDQRIDVAGSGYLAIDRDRLLEQRDQRKVEAVGWRAVLARKASRRSPRLRNDQV